MADYTIGQGENLTATIALTDDDGAQLSLSGATAIRASIIVKETIVYNYMDVSLETLISGYGNCNSGSTIYDLDIVITRAQSATFPVGTATVKVLLKYDSVQTNTYYEYSYALGTIVKGYLKSSTFVN